MSKRERGLAAATVLVVITASAIAWWVLRPAPDADATAAAPLDEDEAELEQWGLVEPGRRPRPVRTSSDEPAPRLPRGPREDDPEWQARRQRWQERWRQAVDIASLGPSAAGIEPDQIREALSPGREALRGCIRNAGGWRALRDARRAERGSTGSEEGASDRGGEGSGRRGRSRRRVSFDVRPDGTVEPDSIEMTPPIADAFDPCFRTFFASARFDTVGQDGARVELPMGPPGGRRGRFDGDGGVPGRRDWGGRRGPPPSEDDPSSGDRGGRGTGRGGVREGGRGAPRPNDPEAP